MSNILVADDSPEMHRLYRTALERSGYRLRFASSGSEALLVMGMHFPDLIILDMAMPQMDGLEFLRLIRQTPEWKKIPVILITAFGAAGQIEATRQFEVAAHFVKANFSIKQLRARIADLLGDTRLATAA